MKLNSINIKFKKKSKRVGRGIGSGKGKTCGRGHKGQKSRSGVSIKSFEGGQMPLYRRIPKRGFNPLVDKNKTAIKNLLDIQKYLENKTILPNDIINISFLKKRNLVNKKSNKLKILGDGEINQKIQVQPDYISKSAKEKIEKIGGKIINPIDNS